MKNEEEIKLKVIAPFLKNLGFTEEEVIFENKFEFRLGTNTFKVGKENNKKALGFSDILCKKGNLNLFIIEVKDQDIDITKDDIEQAISYARLVDPIAPFSIVTNGKSTRIFDTITKIDLTGTNISESSDYWANGLHISLEDELRQRFLAIQSFIGFSEDNILAFSKSQVDARISTLKGDKNNLQKKYIPELYLSNISIESQFEQFIDDEKQLFALIGESGVGKSNTICYLTYKYLAKHVVFFFNGSELIKDILSSIKDDCNWFFSPNLEDEEILSRLLTFTNEDRKIIIFIDAIDEIPYLNFVLELNELAKKLKKYPNVKICISCKSSEWPSFLKIKGNPSSIIDIAYKQVEGENGISKETFDKNLIYGIKLEKFENKDMDDLDVLYRKVFKYKGKLNNELRSELRLGFNFRIFATVFANKQIPKNLNDVNLLEEYLNKTLEKLDYETANNYLMEIAHSILIGSQNSSNKKYTNGYIDEQILRKQLNLGINDKLYPELFSYNILTRLSIYDGNVHIGFYYERLRNFIIATKVLKLHLLSNRDFVAMMNDLINYSIGKEVLLWYYNSSIIKHRSIIEEYYFNNALVFVNTYEKILNNHLMPIKDKFDPYTKDKIGLIINNSIDEGLKLYCFYPIKSDEQCKILHKNFSFDNNTFFQTFNVRTIRSDRNGFFVSNPKSKAREIIFEQLKKIIEKGELSEQNNISILIEKVLAIIHQFYKNLELDIDVKGRYIINFGDVFPIKLDFLLELIKYKFAQRYYEELEIQNLIKRDTIQVRKHNGVISYSVNRNSLDFNSINIKAKDAVNRNLSIPEPNIHGNIPPLKALKETILTLKKFSTEITACHLPSPDINEKNIVENLFKHGGRDRYIQDIIIAQFSDKRLCEYIKIFFELFLKEYKIIIEHNFKGIERQFQLYNNLPVVINCEINTHNRWLLIYGIKKINGESKVNVILNPIKSMFNEDKSEYLLMIGCSVTQLFRNSNIVPIDINVSDKSASELCNLRNFLYDWVGKELKKIKLN